MVEKMEIIIPDTGAAMVESQGILADVRAMVIEDDDLFLSAQVFLKEIKGHILFVKSLYGDEIEQAYGLHKSLKAKENALMEYVREAERILNKKINTYQAKKDALAEAEEAARAREAEILREVGEQPLVQEVVLPDPPPMAKGVWMVEEWTHEIVDEQLLPREYLIPDTARIRDIVRAMKGDTKIPGVKVSKTKKVRSRA